MKKTLRRLAALGLSALLLASPALALTTDELGDILKKEYAGDIPAQVWKETTVEGMLSALGDPFTHYYDPAGYQAFLKQVSGQTGTENRYSVQDGTGLARLDNFGKPEELRDWVRENNAAVDHWIVDLRGNRGGEVRGAVDAMSVFAGGGELLFLREQKDDKLYSVKAGQGRATMEPVVVLTGRMTASAGELYAAAIRDRQQGILVGSRTYGKGVFQSAFDKENTDYGAAFADGSALLLTTGRAFSENLVSNNILGVLPQLMVPDDRAEGVARLLCTDAPLGNTYGYLRLHLARWRWYIKLSEAKADLPAFQALLEALPPQAELYAGAGGDSWYKTTPADVAREQGVGGYTPRVFPDVDGSAYADAINALKTYDILKGDQNGRFNPQNGLDRASLCALLAQAMNYPKSTAAPAFADTPADAWYTPYVTTLSAMGIVNGYDDGLFHPNDPIPHQQFMTILSRIVAGLSASSYGAWQVGPSDEALASGDYAAYDAWAVKGAWLLDGVWHKDAKDIDPKAVTTREEAAYDLWSALSTLAIVPG